MINRHVAVLALALALTTPAIAAAASPLAAYKGNARVLVLSAASETDPALVTQTQWLTAQDIALRERDVIVVRIVGDVVTGAEGLGGDARAWRDSAAVPGRQFVVALIGKDGTQAFKQEQPISAADLFKRIDAMPMRREEMTRRQR